MNGLALCAGIGGLELGIELAVPGYRTVGYVEREAFAASALVARMEDSSLGRAPIWDDLESFDGEPWCGVVDLVSAGFPCQPFSAAGKQRGIEDDRWLWPSVERVICAVQPRWVVLENVPGLVRHGFGPVLGGLAALGFDVEWDLFRASDVGATHERNRIFTRRRDGVDYASGDGDGSSDGEVRPGRNAADDAGGDVADSQGDGCESVSEHDSGPPTGQRVPRRRHVDGCDAEVADRGSERLEGIDRAGSAAGSVRRSGRALADTSSPRRPRRQNAGADSGDEGAHRSGRVEPERVGDPMADTERNGRGPDKSRRIEEGRGVIGRPLPLYPPGPSDVETWGRIVETHPHLAPALPAAPRRAPTGWRTKVAAAQSAIRRMAHGAAALLDFRAERLRAIGNGVVPLQAAYAIRTLAARRPEWLSELKDGR